jgi:hypothetical protein
MKLGRSDQDSESPRYVTTSDFDIHVGCLRVMDDCECAELFDKHTLKDAWVSNTHLSASNPSPKL